MNRKDKLQFIDKLNDFIVCDVKMDTITSIDCDGDIENLYVKMTTGETRIISIAGDNVRGIFKDFVRFLNNPSIYPFFIDKED